MNVPKSFLQKCVYPNVQSLLKSRISPRAQNVFPRLLHRCTRELALKNNFNIHSGTRINLHMRKMSSNSQGRGISRKGMYYLIGGVVVVAYVTALDLYKRNREKEIAKRRLELENSKSMMFTIDKGWKAVTMDGKEVSDTDFVGKWVIVYFGFTHCPDICPEELDKIYEVLQLLKKEKVKVNFTTLFVTIDPERDTKEVLKEYLKDYPGVLGITGTEEEMADMRKKWRIFAQKGPMDEDGDYIVDHSIITYLVQPDGDCVEFFNRSSKVSQMVSAIKRHVKNFQS